MDLFDPCHRAILVIVSIEVIDSEVFFTKYKKIAIYEKKNVKILVKNNFVSNLKCCIFDVLHVRYFARNVVALDCLTATIISLIRFFLSNRSNWQKLLLYRL